MRESPSQLPEPTSARFIPLVERGWKSHGTKSVGAVACSKARSGGLTESCGAAPATISFVPEIYVTGCRGVAIRVLTGAVRGQRGDLAIATILSARTTRRFDEFLPESLVRFIPDLAACSTCMHRAKRSVEIPLYLMR